MSEFEHRAFLLGESGRRGPADGDHRGHFGRYRCRQVEVDAEQSCRRLARHRVGDGGAPVAALGDVAGVAEALHQLRPGSRDVVGVPAGAGWLAGEAVTGNRRHDEVERVFRPSVMSRGIRERADDLEQLDHRAGPAMRHDQRHGVRMTRADVDEVNVHVIDRRHELGQGVEPGLGLSPVVARSPVTHQLLEFCELYALRPIIDRLPVGPARGGDASAEIGKCFFRNIGVEGTDCGVACRHDRMRGAKGTHRCRRGEADGSGRRGGRKHPAPGGR